MRNQPKLSSGLKGFTDKSGEWVCTGAQMGRSNHIPEDKNVSCKLHLRNILTGSDAGYDEEGAYWGTGDPVFWACDHITDLEPMHVGWVEVFIRAKNREEAKVKVRELLPNARFYR
jgi:hypothetical protein